MIATIRSPQAGGARRRKGLDVRGLVQGVGFRPFVYALAAELGLSGQVANTGAGVAIEVEGPARDLAEFERRLLSDAPPLAQIAELAVRDLVALGGTGFAILASESEPGRTLVSPDVATCADCLAELADPTDRRYRHPFVSCTNCGPRFTVVLRLPYDRPATTMADLSLCAACAAEYADPGDRRFHAQTVACRDCGPTLTLHRPGLPDLLADEAIAAARAVLAAGGVVAVKGLGGYHLACDAASQNAVAVLRKRKQRGDKPFAVMVADLAAADGCAVLCPQERELLADPRRPVVLAAGRAHSPLAPAVATGHPEVGLMLPYTPVHHLLFGLPGDPPGPRALVMTSGNLAGEPIVTDDVAARERLAGLADAWLVADRPIAVPCDDSVLRVADGVQLPVRRSRGYAPLPVALPIPVRPALAVGGDLKNTFCLGGDRHAWMSAHVGDMDDLATLAAFEVATGHLSRLTGVEPELLVVDAHPRYRSGAWARRTAAGREIATVGHHHAHVASAMADNGHDGSSPVLGFAFDGTGYGADGAVWGGEVLQADYDTARRVAHLAYVPLPGGDAAVANPCRMALSHLRAAGVGWDRALPAVAACTEIERNLLARQFDTGLACVPTSSMGRLFDAVSSLAGVCHRAAYEAEAAMRFEGAARTALPDVADGYAFAVVGGDPLQLDPGPVLAAVAADVLAGVPAAIVAARFHLAVADAVLDLACRVRDGGGPREVALSGGVFLNLVLTDLCTRRLRDAGFTVLRHRRVPPSDAGLALGQLAIAARVPP